MTFNYGAYGENITLDPHDQDWLEQWLETGQTWGEPDKFEKFDDHSQAVWYSDRSWYDHTKKDRDNSAFAITVESSPESFIITEYIHSSEWDYDMPDEDKPPPHWKMRSVAFKPMDVFKIIVEAVKRKNKETAGTPAGRVRIPRGKPEVIARFAAGIGSAYISYHGGDEDTSESLP